MNRLSRGAAQPLFASSHQLWLRIWLATQSVAICVAVYAILREPRLSNSASHVANLLAVVSSLVAYHIVGVRAFSWMLPRPALMSLFVPLGWAIIIAAIISHGAFATLIFGAMLQGFIFLPFGWGMAALAAVIAVLVAAVVARTGMRDPDLMLVRSVGVVSTGIMFGTVMLYIHRANRDALVRIRLIGQLDAAHRDLADRAREAGAQEERQRLSHDIHDSLAQGFTSVIKHLEAIELSFASSSPPLATEAIRKAEPHLRHAQAVSRASLAEIRRLVLSLRPPQLIATSVGHAIERLVVQWRDANGIEATTQVHEIPPLQPDADVILLRTAQESLSNVARHANASHVQVSLDCIDGLVLLSIEDDGRGIDDIEAAAAGRFGIVGMRERVRRFGGRVLIESSPPRGTSVTVALPLDAVSAAHL